MANYLIHTCPKREYFVRTYIIPSMLENGINEPNISVYNDENMEGNLESWLKSCEQLDDEGGTWHLQDDVLIGKDFKQRTEELDDGIVCGFGSNLYDDINSVGRRYPQYMWWSFPCIRIPNKLAKECAAWTRRYIIGNPVYEDYWKNGTHDDWCFKQFLKTKYPTIQILNVVPTLVEHVDWLIGGSTGKTQRTEACRSLYFKDDDLVTDLQIKLRQASSNKVMTIGKTVWSSGG